ncbi:MAG: transketolase family protein [Clostridiales bacterium]|nr:transketolase family protein [Clostridiales bacterium]
MSIKIAKEIVMDKEEMRNAFCSVLMELAENNKDIIVLDADLMGAMGTRAFQKKYPEQTVNCGIQEANMIGVAAGLSAVGKIPFAHTFAPFATRRVCDQVFMSAAYARNNVKIVGSDPGITASLNGGTHMPFEDMGIMRGLPELTVLEPTDITMLKWMIKEMAATYGVQYMRLVRKNCMKVYEEGSTFEMGKAVQLCDGTDVTIIASGYCVAEAYKAASLLKEAGVSARVLNMFCWKPIDQEAILKAAEETGAIVTAENHNVINGLGSAVAEVLVKNRPTPVEMIGVQDEFGEVGPVDYLSERFKLNASYIVEAAKKVIARKA